MQKNSVFINAAVLLVALFYSQTGFSASCCGGGSASSLLLPKAGQMMFDLSVDTEQYDGFWNSAGQHVSDPEGSDLSQLRINAGIGYRLSPNWQVSLVVPYVWNDNQYAGFETQTNGVGDSVASIWYEAFDVITCVYKVNSIADLKPSIYYGLSLTVPTGVSPYGDVANSFDITGRGFYRLDASLMMEKTVFPWNASLQLSHGVYVERPVNREYGNYVEPYDKNLGDRQLFTVSFGYTDQTEKLGTLTYTLAYADLSENTGEIEGVIDPTGGLEKQSLSFTVAFSNFDKDKIYKLSYNKATDGKNFPATDVLTVGASYVFY